jgi:hypothetical protein
VMALSMSGSPMVAPISTDGGRKFTASPKTVRAPKTRGRWKARTSSYYVRPTSSRKGGGR